jgi:hypothetical protein
MIFCEKSTENTLKLRLKRSFTTRSSHSLMSSCLWGPMNKKIIHSSPHTLDRISSLQKPIYRMCEKRNLFYRLSLYYGRKCVNRDFYYYLSTVMMDHLLHLNLKRRMLLFGFDIKFFNLLKSIFYGNGICRWGIRPVRLSLVCGAH